MFILVQGGRVAAAAYTADELLSSLPYRLDGGCVVPTPHGYLLAEGGFFRVATPEDAAAAQAADCYREKHFEDEQSGRQVLLVTATNVLPRTVRRSAAARSE